MLRLLVFIVLLTCTLPGFSQVRATTESGNKVLLFDNGTWQYEENNLDATAIETTVAAGVVGASIVVDSTRDTETEWEEIFYLPSPRLVKYFGEAKGQIRCKLSCSNNNGKVQINFKWEIPNVDGNGYFGNFKAGSKVTVHMLDGQEVELLVAEGSKIEKMERYNFSVISGATQPLSNEQIAALCAQPFRKIIVGWKKKPETYEVEISSYFINTLPTVY